MGGTDTLTRLAQTQNATPPPDKNFGDYLAARILPDLASPDPSAPAEHKMPPRRTPFSIQNETPRDEKLYEQCEALETFLLKTLISGMRKTVEKSEFNKGGFAGEMYEDMLYDEYAKDFSKNAGFGLAELAYLELTGQRGKLL
jgi:flagellar protein FlgJ